MKTLRSAKFRLVAVAAILSLATPPPTRAAVLFNGDVPIAPYITNPCNGETVVLLGRGHLVIEETAGGSFHYSLHLNLQGVSGVGVITGAMYSISDSVNFEETASSVFEFTANETFHVIGQGQVPNFDLHLLLHTTIDANGNQTAVVDNATTECH